MDFPIFRSYWDILDLFSDASLTIPQIPKPTSKNPTNAKGKPLIMLPISEGYLVKNNWRNITANIKTTPPSAKVMIPLIAYCPKVITL